MSFEQIEGTNGVVRAIIAAENAHNGYPVRHLPRGRQSRKPLRASPPSWAGRPDDAPPPGWTSTYAKVEQHPDTPSLRAVPVQGAEMRSRVIGATFAGRTIQEADIVVRGRDWDPVVEVVPQGRTAQERGVRGRGSVE